MALLALPELATFKAVGGRFAVEPVVAGFPPPFEAEVLQVRHAVPKRRAEFAAGRRAAHRALNELGVCPMPLLSRVDRTVVWPRGFVGSISHSATLAVAAIAPADPLHGLGFDVEPDAPLPRELVQLVCNTNEQMSLAAWAERFRGDPGRLIFSAKEAFYKSYFPIFGSFLDFKDVEISFAPDGRRFSAQVVNSSKPDPHAAGLVGEGAFACSHGHIAIVFALSRAK